MGILTVNKTLSTSYTSGTRSMPGPNCSKNVLLLEPFGFYSSGFGTGEWFGIYVRQGHILKIPIKFGNQSYTELNIKKSTLHASYVHICILVYRILIYIIHNRSFLGWDRLWHTVYDRVSHFYVIQSRSIQRFLLWKPCLYNHWKPCNIHVVRPMSQVMYSSCLSITMAGRPIDVETVMTIWSCYILTCELPNEVKKILLGLAWISIFDLYPQCFNNLSLHLVWWN